MSRRHLFLSILIHTFIILFLIYFPWNMIKKNKIETIELIDIQPVTPPNTNPIEQKEEQVKEEILEPKKEEIPIPVKTTERKIIPKPKPKPKPKKIIPPPPKLESNLKDKLKDLKKPPEEDLKEEESKNIESDDSDLKKNPQYGQDSVN